MMYPPRNIVQLFDWLVIVATLVHGLLAHRLLLGGHEVVFSLGTCLVFFAIIAHIIITAVNVVDWTPLPPLFLPCIVGIVFYAGNVAVSVSKWMETKNRVSLAANAAMEYDINHKDVHVIVRHFHSFPHGWMDDRLDEEERRVGRVLTAAESKRYRRRIVKQLATVLTVPTENE